VWGFAIWGSFGYTGGNCGRVVCRVLSLMVMMMIQYSYGVGMRWVLVLLGAWVLWQGSAWAASQILCSN